MRRKPRKSNPGQPRGSKKVRAWRVPGWVWKAAEVVGKWAIQVVVAWWAVQRKAG
ncbi:MAG TPA: hypothetical protein VH092_30815 [Urbifossiella sp.]|jgi:hypothetical protein|nr:hypothetical protein [Urbifossiella sp.]